MSDVDSIADAESDTLQYNGCEIVLWVFELEATSNWGARVLIRRGRHSDSREESFTSSDAWLNGDEARRHAIHFGKRVVDGYVPDLTWEHDHLETRG